ncbi:hypothetical protein D9C73_015721 [Collichthys lucidus]|uniref:Uncharacterized protein n=1 Tax=Collichthys lucidus TaxID=240159 RepID=A0A4U5V1N3_COLLU|nr:hypothetical protein D9C73_015721 [Collichthys lucidus]
MLNLQAPHLQTLHLHLQASFYNLEAASTFRLWQTAVATSVSQQPADNHTYQLLSRTYKPPPPGQIVRSTRMDTRPNTLELGRRIKTELWERLGRPSFTESVSEDGLMTIDQRFGVGVHPPHYDVDICSEPKPGKPKQKRARNLCQQHAARLHLQSLAGNSACGKQLYPDPPPAASSTNLKHASTYCLWQAALTDPPPTCLCHQPAGRLHLQTVARPPLPSAYSPLPPPAACHSLQVEAACRLVAEAAFRVPPPVDYGKQLVDGGSDKASCPNLQVEADCRLVAEADSCTLTLHLPASATSLQAVSTCRLWQAALTGYNLQV